MTGCFQEGRSENQTKREIMAMHIRAQGRPWETRCGATPTKDDLTSRAALAIVERYPQEAAAALARYDVCAICFRQFSVVALNMVTR
jgi:hypothetical protein